MANFVIAFNLVLHPLAGMRLFQIGVLAAVWWLGLGPAGAAPLRVVTTTSMVTDLVRQVAGEAAEVQGLMGPGVDPHLYKPVAADVLKLQRADVIFYNGLVLEGKMTDLFTKLARTKKQVYALAEAVPEELLLQPPEFAGHHDPHLWFDVSLWEKCIDVVREGLSAADPENAAHYARRAAELRLRMQQLHQWALAKAAELPPEKRILVTSHDAYNYFGRAYGFTVVGLQGISTASEAGLADVARLVDFIRERRIRAIFVESSVPHATIERVAADSGVRVGGELFSDAMGTPGQIVNGYDLGTYEGMIRHNLTTIVEALK
ncbi:MAG: ABC transporter substrate-binding protein [Opitutus sp.]|nr:ABC transporter substrate-binding protein [Opitutus sp.]